MTEDMVHILLPSTWGLNHTAAPLYVEVGDALQHLAHLDAFSVVFTDKRTPITFPFLRDGSSCSVIERSIISEV
jgi:hypothetical protein